MLSIARNHFPQYVFRDGAKLLWNPILKKAFVDLPEERVRLQIVEYLILEAGFSTSRVSFESPVNLPRDKSASRTDVICFNKEFRPHLLIECKAPEIKLNEKASIQIARYNQKIGAPFLLISNGVEDFWFHSKNETINLLTEIPEIFQASSSVKTNFEYWSKRGFAGNKSHPDTRKWIQQNCELLYNIENKTSLNYFKFEGSLPGLYMANYYRVFDTTDSKKLAISLTATPFGATKLNVVLNDQGRNTALLSCSLDLLATNDSKNTLLQTSAQKSIIDISKSSGFELSENIPSQLEKLSGIMN